MLDLRSWNEYLGKECNEEKLKQAFPSFDSLPPDSPWQEKHRKKLWREGEGSIVSSLRMHFWLQQFSTIAPLYHSCKLESAGQQPSHPS